MHQPKKIKIKNYKTINKLTEIKMAAIYNINVQKMIIETRTTEIKYRTFIFTKKFYKKK